MNWTDLIQTAALFGLTFVVMLQSYEIGRLQSACEMLREIVRLLYQQQTDLEETVNATA